MPDQELNNVENDAEQQAAADNKKSGNKTKTYLWAAFGVACVLALVLPAAWVVYNNSQAVGDVPNLVDSAPTKPQQPANEGEQDPATEPEDGVATELGEDLEMWDYSTSGRNVFKSTIPVRLTPNTSTNNDNEDIESDDIILKSIGKNSDDELIAVFTVKGKQYEVGVGDQIGTTGWYVKTITASSVSLSQTAGSIDKTLDEDDSGK